MITQPTRLDMAIAKAAQARCNFACTPPPAGEVHVPVVIVGAGPAGLALALDLRQKGVECAVLERHSGFSDASRAVCWSKRTLEICDRLGAAEMMRAMGVTWNVGRVYRGAAPDPLFSFDLLPVGDQKFPAFINLQQYYTEEFLVAAFAGEFPLRWRHEVTSVTPRTDGVILDVATPQGDYRLHCDYLIAADGSRSTVRSLLGLDFDGRTFEDNFLIVDLRMKNDLPAERRFWFDAQFNEGRTALLHQQPDDIWRLDFQLGWDIDREAAVREENVTPRVRAMLEEIGPGIEFDYEWVSLYTFQCRRMKRFVHGRVIFAGDSAHLVSPFGARGANSGIQDADNLGWKLAMVLEGRAGTSLLESYNTERVQAADENLLQSSRSTDFMTPRTPLTTAFRDAVLELASTHPFARGYVNSGRLSVPCHYRNSPLNTPDLDSYYSAMQPGMVCLDAPLPAGEGRNWLLESLGGRFVMLHFVDGPYAQSEAVRAAIPPGIDWLDVSRSPGQGRAHDPGGVLWRRYDARPGTLCLIRPDQHLVARWRQFDARSVQTAFARACGFPQ